MSKDTTKRALHRLKIIQGQLSGLEKRIADDVYCMDILTQSRAIQKSLASLDALIVSRHLETHISEKMTSGDDKQTKEALKELAQIYEFNSKG